MRWQMQPRTQGPAAHRGWSPRPLPMPTLSTDPPQPQPQRMPMPMPEPMQLSLSAPLPISALTPAPGTVSDPGPRQAGIQLPEPELTRPAARPALAPPAGVPGARRGSPEAPARLPLPRPCPEPAAEPQPPPAATPARSMHCDRHRCLAPCRSRPAHDPPYQAGRDIAGPDCCCRVGHAAVLRRIRRASRNRRSAESRSCPAYRSNCRATRRISRRTCMMTSPTALPGHDPRPGLRTRPPSA